MLYHQTGQANLEPTALADIHSHFNCAYDPQFGARPLKRVVQEQLLNPLSMKLLEGEFKPGDKIKVGAKDGGVVFSRKQV